jgi:hypothetical protein
MGDTTRKSAEPVPSVSSMLNGLIGGERPSAPAHFLVSALLGEHNAVAVRVDGAVHDPARAWRLEVLAP